MFGLFDLPNENELLEKQTKWIRKWKCKNEKYLMKQKINTHMCEHR